MEKWFEASLTSLIAIGLSAIGIYLAIIIFTRLAGKRSFSKMSGFDFAITIAIGSIIASSILSSSVSLLQGVFGLAMVYLLQSCMAILRRFNWFQETVDNSPLLLMDGKDILYKNLKKARVTESDLRSKLREANVIELSEVRAVVFEATGDISVLHSAEDDKNLESWLLKDVMN